MTLANRFEWLEGDDGVDLRFPLKGEKIAILKTRLRYRRANGKERVADVGLITDGTSNPPISWPFIGHPFDSAHCRESIVHDEGYQRAPADEGSVWKAMRSEQRREEDESYREALHANPRLTTARAEVIYRMVRLFGWWAWRRHARNNALVAQEVSNG